MRQKLKTFYGEDVSLVVYPGDKTAVLQTGSEPILKTFYSQKPKESTQQEKMRIIQTAVLLIREGIVSFESDDNYPTAESVKSLSDSVPHSLKTLLRYLINHDDQLKSTSIAQALMQAVRPRSLLMPLQLGLAVHLHNRLGKKNIINELWALGFCKSYKEVRKFLRCAAVSVSDHNLAPNPDQNIQFKADNVDWGKDTIDGRYTVHWMGQIAAITPAESLQGHMPRRKVSTHEISELSSVIVKYFNMENSKKLDGSKFEKYSLEPVQDKYKYLDLLYKCKMLVKSKSPLWSGFMQTVFGMREAVKSTAIAFLPMIATYHLQI